MHRKTLLASLAALLVATGVAFAQCGGGKKTSAEKAGGGCSYTKAAASESGCSKDKAASACSKDKSAGCGDNKSASAACSKGCKCSGTSCDKGCKCGNNIVETAAAAGSFNTLVKALNAAGLADCAAGKGPYTVFAPTDEAFSRLPEGTLDALLKDLPKLRAILKHHIVEGRVMAADVIKMDSATSLLGQKLAVRAGDRVEVGGATVIKTDIAASNGLIHVIDRVILPADSVIDVARSAGSFKTLLAAVSAAGLEDDLRGGGPITVLAPSDEAFAKLPQGAVEGLLKDLPKLRTVLKHHVLPGRHDSKAIAGMDSARTLLGQTVSIRVASPIHINGHATVVKADIEAANGLIHVIDEVIMPSDDVVDVARSAGDFGTLLKAVDAAGLTDTLRGEGPFTVFAPTDEAFARLPAGTLEGLLGDPEKLKSVLLYHVVPGKVAAADVAKLSEAKTALGKPVHISTADDVRVQGAKVLKTDIQAANGIIHVIDAVIVPE